MDYVHMRLLAGSIANWDALFAEAYQVLRPGGWVESMENHPFVMSDDNTVTEATALGQWGRLFANFGDTIGRSFTIAGDGVQRRAMQAAGFVDIQEVDYKVCELRLGPLLLVYPIPYLSIFLPISSDSLTVPVCGLHM